MCRVYGDKMSITISCLNLNSSLEECFFSQSLLSHRDNGSLIKTELLGCRYLKNSYTHRCRYLKNSYTSGVPILPPQALSITKYINSRNYYMVVKFKSETEPLANFINSAMANP